MKVGKPKSKRTPVRLRHKIEKASAAKQRKERKLAKKNPQWRSRLKKDPGIPNLFPYKDRLLHEVEEQQRLKKEEMLKKKEEAKQRRKLMQSAAEENNGDVVIKDELDVDDIEDEEDENDGMEIEDEEANPMAALLASARARAAEYEQEHHPNRDDDAVSDISASDIPATSLSSNTTDPSLRAYAKPLAHVLANANIILHVLDARDPLSTLSKTLSHTITSSTSPKQQVLILNKADLVPTPVLKRWLSHLRRTAPTLPLIASKPAAGAKTFNHASLSAKSTSDRLFKALKAIANSKSMQSKGTTCTVGVVGFPNVGKSSVINALASRIGRANPSHAVCPVGAEAGITTSVREVKLDSKLHILDCPGMVFAPSAYDNVSSLTPAQLKLEKEDRTARLTLLSALPPSSPLTNPQAAITLLLARLDGSSDSSRLKSFLEHYGIVILSPSDPTTDFLIQVARKRGRLGKGGIPDLKAAAMLVVGDWRDGRVEGWADPPKLEDENANDEVEIVSEWADEFKIEGLWGESEGDEMKE